MKEVTNTMKSNKVGALKTYFRFIYSVYVNNKSFVVLKVFISILSGILTVTTAIIPKYMADAILIYHSKYDFLVYVMIYILAQFIIGAIYNFIELYINKTLVKVNAKCTENVLENLYNMTYEHYEHPDSRNCIERAFNFATKTGVSSFNMFLTLISTAITFLSYVYIIVRHNWITLVFLSISVIVTYILQKQKAEYEYSLKHSLTMDERKIGYYKSALLDKSLAKDIRYSGAFGLLKHYYNDEIQNYSDKLFKKSKRLYLYNQIINAIQLSVIFAVMLSFGWRLFNGSMTYGDYTISVNVSMSFTSLMFTLIGNITSIYSVILDSINYDDFLKITSSEKNNMCPFNPTITFNNVNFRYGTENRLAIKNFSYSFEYGKKYAIVGENGSGKSTILKLLLGMYIPDEGNIMIGDISIKDISPKSLYSLYSVVFQDFKLLNGISLKDNITVGMDKMDEDRISDIIDIVGLKTRLTGNDKYSPLLREYSRIFNNDGIELSGGENQKMVIARALLKESPIVVMDEPTSAFDESSQECFFESVFKDYDKTIIFVTHDQKLANWADEILIMKNGELIDIIQNYD